MLPLCDATPFNGFLCLSAATVFLVYCCQRDSNPRRWTNGRPPEPPSVKLRLRLRKVFMKVAFLSLAEVFRENRSSLSLSLSLSLTLSHSLTLSASPLLLPLSLSLSLSQYLPFLLSHFASPFFISTFAENFFQKLKKDEKQKLASGLERTNAFF